MNFISNEDINTFCESLKRLTYERKIEIAKQYVKRLYTMLYDSRLRKQPNIDRDYLKEAANMCIATMIAYSAGGNGEYSRKEYQFCCDLFGDDYKARYDLSLSNYDNFCYQMESHKGNFWTNNFIELTKYISANNMQAIALYMFIFASADGEVVSSKRTSIINFLNKCYCI